VEKGAKQLQDWKSAIKFGVLDATGISRDFVKKGFHLHFNELEGLELSVKFKAAEKVGEEGSLVLGFISGNQDYVKNAIKTFNSAFANQKFRNQLLVKLKAAQETLTGATKVLKNAAERRQKDQQKLKI
jgi:hypothetical protein